jgi:hypothetical protein
MWSRPWRSHSSALLPCNLDSTNSPLPFHDRDPSVCHSRSPLNPRPAPHGVHKHPLLLTRWCYHLAHTKGSSRWYTMICLFFIFNI